jgi:hypothetical protein
MRFNELKRDEAYAGVIEMGRDEMVSSQFLLLSFGVLVVILNIIRGGDLWQITLLCHR